MEEIDITLYGFCENCLFWQRGEFPDPTMTNPHAEGDIGVCQESPPTVIGNHMCYRSVWPQTHRLRGCGHFEPNEPPPDDPEREDIPEEEGDGRLNDNVAAPRLKAVA